MRKFYKNLLYLLINGEKILPQHKLMLALFTGYGIPFLFSFELLKLFAFWTLYVNAADSRNYCRKVNHILMLSHKLWNSNF
jgi:hypothetical protein